MLEKWRLSKCKGEGGSPCLEAKPLFFSYLSNALLTLPSQQGYSNLALRKSKVSIEENKFSGRSVSKTTSSRTTSLSDVVPPTGLALKTVPSSLYESAERMTREAHAV